MKVYIVEGWFGDVEWMEDIYAVEAAAEKRCEELWKTRSGKGPEYSRGLHKFAVEEYEVIP